MLPDQALTHSGLPFHATNPLGGCHRFTSRITEFARRASGSETLSSMSPAAEPEFMLRVDEPLTRGLCRILIEQVGVGIHLLRHEPDLDIAVHEMRKSMKRSRAVLRLVRGRLGRWRYRQENVVLRDLARRWAPPRDAVVIHQVTTEVLEATGLTGDGPGPDLLRTLRSRAAATSRRYVADRPMQLHTLTTLLALRSRVAAFGDRGESFPDDFSSLRSGMQRVARRSGAEMRRALADPTTEHLHQWRKRVKYVGYHIEVLARVWPELMDAYSQRLKQIGDALGSEHDLAVISEMLEGEPELAPDPAWRGELLARIADRRAELQATAFAAGATVFTAPGRLGGQIGDAWPLGRQDAVAAG